MRETILVGLRRKRARVGEGAMRIGEAVHGERGGDGCSRTGRRMDVVRLEWDLGLEV